jgi:hypothetical protein
MATVLFINRTDLVKNTILNGNVDTDTFIQFIKIAQQMHVQNYLGTQLYNKITQLIVDNDLDGDYLDLVVEYVQPMLIHYAMVDYLPFANYQIRNGGVFKHRSENSESTTKEELDLLVQKHRSFADFYTKRFVDYANFFATQRFPEYWTNRNNDMFPDSNTNHVNWVL